MIDSIIIIRGLTAEVAIAFTEISPILSVNGPLHHTTEAQCIINGRVDRAAADRITDSMEFKTALPRAGSGLRLTRDQAVDIGDTLIARSVAQAEIQVGRGRRSLFD